MPRFSSSWSPASFDRAAARRATNRFGLPIDADDSHCRHVSPHAHARPDRRSVRLARNAPVNEAVDWRSTCGFLTGRIPMKPSRMLVAASCVVILFGTAPEVFAQRGGGFRGGGFRGGFGGGRIGGMGMSRGGFGGGRVGGMGMSRGGFGGMRAGGFRGPMGARGFGGMRGPVVNSGGFGGFRGGVIHNGGF